MPKASRSTKHSPVPNTAPRSRTNGSNAEDVEATPRAIRTSGVGVDAALRGYVARTLSDRFAPYAAQIEGTTVRFDDEKAARGVTNSVCRIRVELRAMQTTIHTESSALTAEEAFDGAAEMATRELRRIVKRPNARGRATRGRGEATSSKAILVPKDTSATQLRQIKRRPLPNPEDGSLVGRRVGRAATNVRRATERPEKHDRSATVDTALPGWSATDRRAGGTSTAARNAKLNTAGMTSALEDSTKLRPSRVSTRRSADHAKRDSNLRIRQTNRVHSPRSRATR